MGISTRKLSGRTDIAVQSFTLLVTQNKHSQEGCQSDSEDSDSISIFTRQDGGTDSVTEIQLFSPPNGLMENKL